MVFWAYSSGRGDARASLETKHFLPIWQLEELDEDLVVLAGSLDRDGRRW